MASEDKTPAFDIRKPVLILYIGVCVLMVVATLGLAFLEPGAADSSVTPTATRTLSPAVQTLQAEGYQGEGRGSGGGGGQGGGQHQATPEVTREPEPTPTS